MVILGIIVIGDCFVVFDIYIIVLIFVFSIGIVYVL